MNFDSFAFHPQIRAGITALNYSTPTPIQERTIPPILEGKDVMGLAQTGTGKTAAFLIAVFTRLLRNTKSAGTNDPRALILAPTRELVLTTAGRILVVLNAVVPEFVDWLVTRWRRHEQGRAAVTLPVESSLVYCGISPALNPLFAKRFTFMPVRKETL